MLIIHNPRKQLSARGFTLIEMMVAVTILLLMVGGGIAAYLNFNDKQTVKGEGQKLQTILRQAQKKARSGDKPTACETAGTALTGYAVRMAAGSSVVRVVARCNNADAEIKTESLNVSVTSETAFNIEFKVLKGGVSGAGVITLTNGTTRFRFTVGAGGQVEGGTIL